MKRQLTFQEYRSVDLALFAAMLVFSEYVITSAAVKWFPGQPYTVSVTGAICAIVLMRWGAWAGLHAILGGAVFCAVSGGSAGQFAIYCIGNLGCLGALALLRLLGVERIRKDKLYSLLFALVTLLLMQLGRAAVAWLLGTEIAGCAGFFTTDALSGLFSMVIIYIARQLDGVFENQKTYLIRLQEQKKKKGGF